MSEVHRAFWWPLAGALPLLGALACESATTTASLEPDAGMPRDASVAEAGCNPAGSVPGCPCAIKTPGTTVRVGTLACASGVGPAAVACGQKPRDRDSGVAFDAGDASVWVPFFTCPGKDKCSAVTTYDELTCSDESTGAIRYYAILGGPCFHEDEGACSLDLGTLMECESGTWTAFTVCANHSCIQEGTRPACASP